MIFVTDSLLLHPLSIPIAVDPSAHLDLHGYQLYDGVRHSLAVTQQPLDLTPGAGNAEPGHDQHSSRAEQMLERCRMLKCQYFASEADGDSAHLQELLGLYPKLVKQLQQEGHAGLACQAMNETGDLTHHKIGVR